MSFPNTAGEKHEMGELQIIYAGQATPRNRFTETEKLQLARLCVLHGGEFSVRGGRERFWLKIQQLFGNALRRPVSNPCSTMARMLAEYNTKVSREIKESGTAQTDGEYKQTMTQWKARVESSSDGRGNLGSISEKEKERKAQDDTAAEAHRQRLLSTMKGKRDYEAAISALDTHYVVGSEDEGGEGENNGGEGSERAGDKKREGKGKSVSAQTTTKTAIKKEKVETLRDKRRKIRERGELLDASLAKESDRLTAVLERVANSLVPDTSENKLIDQDANTLQERFEVTENRLKALETRLETTEQALGEVKDNTAEILRVLQSK